MNERIRELALQAEKLKRDEVSYRERLHNRYLTGDMEEEIFREKFAQLIVQECARLAMTQHTSTSPAELLDMEPYDQGCDDTASTISGMIRRTFGVE